MQFTSTIERWFEHERGGSLVLPNGWFGRPYDNQHCLTSLQESGDVLTLILDEKLSLRFDGLSFVEVRDRDLVFGGFNKLRFAWKPYGSEGDGGTTEYEAGEVRIARAPG